MINPNTLRSALQNSTQKSITLALTLSTLSTVACATSPSPDQAKNTNALATSTRAPSVANAASEEKVYTFESDANGFNTKTYFYDNGEEVVAFDTQFTAQAAQASLDFLRTQTNHPVTFAVITHPNPDKFNGIATFKAQGAKIIASNLTVQNMPGVQAYKQYYFVQIAKMFTNDSYPKLDTVDQTFDTKLNLKLKNGETIQLEELATPGVSTNQTIAYIPRAKALIVGDIVHYKAHAWLEGGIVNGQPTPTIAGWIADLNRLNSEFGKFSPTVYGGRGQTADLKAAVNAQVNYLTRAQAIVSDYVQSLGDRQVELDGPNAGQHYTAIQKIFEREFPDYDLSYMIQYGVYGLVNSIHHAQK